MRLHSITLANFRSFEAESEIPLGRITSVIGRNGAGKSHVLDGLQKISAILSGGDYKPDRADYFDDNDEAEMRLGATFELSDSAQRALLERPRTKSAASSDDLVGKPLFRLVRYTAAFKGGALQRQEICLSDRDGKLQPFVIAALRGKRYDTDLRHIEDVNLKNPILPDIQSYHRQEEQRPSMEYLFGKLDHSLSDAVQGLFSGVRFIPTDRVIPDKVPAHQSDDLAPDGRNLPNELNDLRRADQDRFDEIMASITHGDPLGIEPHTAGTDLVLKAREEGLSRGTIHTDLGSGQLQTLILGWLVFRQRGTIIVVKEPELHLHAERQRQILRLIRDRSAGDGTQFVIETHSPVFLGNSNDEHVVLVTKDASRSSAAEIGPENVGLIRRELGITHADTLHPPNILFVEGLSDRIVFDAFLRVVSPEHAFLTTIYSLHGARKTINLGALINYLKAGGSRMFAILDEDEEVRRQVEELEEDGLLDDNYHFLAKSLEDEFDSDLIVKAAGEVAAAAGVELSLDAGELQDGREGDDTVIEVVKKHWAKSTCTTLSKPELARRMVSLLDGHPPRGIRVALEAAVGHFKKDDDDDARGRTAAPSGGTGGRS